VKILFFDTETTGLPKNWKAPTEQLDNWPRLVQIAWQVYNSNGDLLEEHEYVIRPVGFMIPSEAIAVHKITTEKALEIGVDLLTILKVFSSSVKNCDLMVAHNYSYDYNIMGSELLRNGLENSLKVKEYLCTMNASTDFCKIPGPYGYKWPKLEELYYELFQGNFNAHNALDDIRACAKCFWKLNDFGILNLNLNKENKVVENNFTIKKKNNSQPLVDFLVSQGATKMDLVRNPNTGKRFFSVVGTEIRGEVANDVEELQAENIVTWIESENKEGYYLLHRENVDLNKNTSASDIMGIYDIEVQLIINKIIDAKNKRLDWLNENNWSISKAGELELIIYYLFYVLKSLIYGGYTELQTKEIEKEEDGEIIWKNTYLCGKILVNDSIIQQLSIFFKNFIKIKCEEIGHSYNDFQIIELINARFSLFRFDDIFMMQSFDGGGIYVNNEIYKLILTNPIQNKVIVKENHAYIVNENGDKIKDLKFDSQWMLDSIDHLMYSLDFAAQKYFYNKISPEIRLDEIISIINATLEEKIIKAHLVASAISEKDYRDKAYADIVHILINKGEKSEALKTVKLISKENTFASLNAYGSICSYLIKNNETEEALRLADVALNKTISDRYHYQLYYWIVFSMAQIGETSQALLFYEKIKVSDTDSRIHKHWAINSICRELISIGKKEQAIELAKKFKPYLGFLYPIVEISKILLKNNETDKVKSIIKQIESNGIKEAIHKELIIYYLQNRNKEEAYQIIYDNYINDNKASVLSDIVPHIMDNFTLDEAFIIAESIIDEHKIYCSAAYLSICKHMANMGKFPEALKIIDKIVDIGYAKEAHSEIAIILMRKGLEKDALNSIELMNQKYDDASNEIDDTYFEFSKHLITNGNNEKALEYVKKIKSKPIRKKAFKFIVNYLLEEENWKEAFELAETCDCNSYASWKRSRLFLEPGDVLSIFLDT